MLVGSDLIGQRSETVRRANLSAIVRELHLRGPQSRSELVARTGLTRTAIRALIGELVAGNLFVEERGTPLGAPGRPSPLVRPKPGVAVVLALDIAVDSLAAALVGVGGEVIECIRIVRPRGHFSVDEIVADLGGVVRQLPGIEGRRDAIIAIGVAVAGIVRRVDGMVSSAPNLGWRDVPLGDVISRELDIAAPVFVANEADLGALVELMRGAARGADDLLFIAGEVGVGGGIVVGGRPLTGVAGYAGEIGHLPLNTNGRPCRCGSIGCWETEIGEEALLRRAGRATAGGSRAVEDVLAAAEGGDPAALGALEEVGRWLGRGIAGLVNVLNPRVVVLGGLYSRLYGFIVADVEAELDRVALAAPRANVRLAPAALGADAPLLGAAELAFEPFLARPADWLGAREATPTAASA